MFASGFNTRKSWSWGGANSSAQVALLGLLFVLWAAAGVRGDWMTGAPPRWGAGMPVGEYGVVNLNTGRVLTTLPVVGWGGKGPSISFSLYHNMSSPYRRLSNPLPLEPLKGDANFDEVVTTDDIDPFIAVLLDPAPTPQQLAVCDMDDNGVVDVEDGILLLGSIEPEYCIPLWTHSYSSRLVWFGNNLKLIADAGTEYLFTDAGGGQYTPPPGVFATLAADDPNDPNTAFTLTSKAQWKVHYRYVLGAQLDYALDYIADPSGNRVTCSYIEDPNDPAFGNLYQVTDAADRALTLTYNAQGRLKWINDPLPGNESRCWRLLYEDPNAPLGFSEQGVGAFRVLEDPMGYWIRWEYSSCGEIAAISDKNGTAESPRYYYAFTYIGGRLRWVTDPAPFTSQTQSFVYSLPTIDEHQTTYTDRRGQLWRYRFDAETGNLTQTEDPLGHEQSFAYEAFGDPLMHEKTGYTNALLNTWTTEYDPRGNVLTTTDPLNHKTTFTYDSLNNLETVAPPLDDNGNSNSAKMVTYHYDDPNDPNAPPLHPTSVKWIEEPKADPNDPNSPTPVTTIVYYDANYAAGTVNGLVRSVTPPYDEVNGSPVMTEYTYDEYGQRSYEREGPPSGGRTDITSVGTGSSSDAAGRVTGGSSAYGCGDLLLDANGNVIGSVCCFMFAPPGGGRSASLPFATCGAPNPTALYGEFENAQYSRMGELEELVNTISGGAGEESTRNHTAAFDHLGRMTARSMSTTEAGWDRPGQPAFARGFTFQEDWTTGTADRTGPDAQVTHTATDIAGRVNSFTRGAITATVTYYHDDAVEYVTYGNGTRTHYIYDDAGRPAVIRHETTSEATIQQLTYVWTADGLVDFITEIDDANNSSTIDFTYDQRNRLTAEARTGQHPYNFMYLYDMAGNRTHKVDVLNELQTDYVYDVSNPEQYGSQGNRLMSSTLSGPSGLIEERWYEYDDAGNVTLVVRRIAGDADENGQWYRGTRLYYTKDGHVWLSRAERWQYLPGEEGSGCENGPPEQGPPTGCVVTNCEAYAAMEYRYAGGRARYMVRPRDPVTMLPYSADDGQWFDYDGDGIYGDLSVSYNQQSGLLNVTNLMAHEPGLAQYDHAAEALHHLHGNLIGTTERMTDATGAIARHFVYTAFGERLDIVEPPPTVDTRYGYAGAFGYQSAGSQAPADPLAELGWLHVGERYYDPSAGRFAQRDPIGIRAGLNTYEYVASNPTASADPAGLQLIGVRPATPFTPGGSRVPLGYRPPVVGPDTETVTPQEPTGDIVIDTQNRLAAVCATMINIDLPPAINPDCIVRPPRPNTIRAWNPPPPAPPADSGPSWIKRALIWLLKPINYPTGVIVFDGRIDK